jgi:hypothetical protein
MEGEMVDPARRAKLLRELEQEFIPDYDAINMPSADKRAAYALEHIAFRVGKMEESLAKIAAAVEAILNKTS